MLEKTKAVMLGHAVADALGVPVEFCSREELAANPIKDMEGFGTYPFPKGCWSDDTSMSLCVLESLTKNKIDYEDIMNNFGKWYFKDEFTPTGEMFDVGNACSTAIEKYFKDKLPLNQCGLKDEYSNGNGSLMRIHPMALYLYTRDDFTLEEKLEIIHNASALTHAHERSKIGCGIYSFVLWELLKEPDKINIFEGLKKAMLFYRDYPEFQKYSRIFEKPFVISKQEEIYSTGYVVYTLEAALWCLLTTTSYEECVLKAVNLGDDTDTVGAVAGGLAGALYGYNAIPAKWLKVIKRKDYIEDMCERASNSW